MRILAATILVFFMSHPASASPLTDSIADDLAQREREISAAANAGKYCEARRRANETIADLDTALDQIMEGRPIHMQRVTSISAVASPSDESWIILRKYALLPIMYHFMFLCPR